MGFDRFERVTRNLSSGLHVYRVTTERPTAAAKAPVASRPVDEAEAGDQKGSMSMDPDRFEWITRNLSSGLHRLHVSSQRPTAAAKAPVAPHSGSRPDQLA